MYGIIATWRMALEGITEADAMLKEKENAKDAIETAIKAVEDFEFYKSVGYGGLPNEEMEVELDAAFMDGDTLDVGCVSYEIVRLMKEGMHPQLACEKAVKDFDTELRQRRGKAGDMSLIAMNNKGEWGCATNIEGFSFAVCTEKEKPTVYLVKFDEKGKQYFEPASKEWMDHYMASRTAPLIRK